MTSPARSAGSRRVRRIALAACGCALLLATHLAGAEKQWPKVVYVVDFGKYTDDAVLALQNCCGDSNKVVPVDSRVRGCPPGLKTCEFVRLDAPEGTPMFRIVNQYNPVDESHNKLPAMMDGYRKFASQNPASQKIELLKTLRSVVTCHDVSHGGTGNPGSIEAFCQDCRPFVAAPQLPLKTR